MQKVLTAAEMREVDRLTTERYGIPSIILMENAAHAVARVITDKLGGSVKGKSILILCGKGNNGGDGAALARILWTAGADVEVILFGDPKGSKGDARTNFEICSELSEQTQGELAFGYIEEFWEFSQLLTAQVRENFCCIVDAVFGTGLTKQVDASLFEIFRCFPNRLHIAVDIPSGLYADKPIAKHLQYTASVTVTFTAPKPANVLPHASNFNGELVIADIGSPSNLVDAQPSQLFLAEREDASEWLQAARFTEDSYKSKRGHALVIAGSEDYSGAAVLAANAAMRSGVGLVTLACPADAKAQIASRLLPEVILSTVESKEFDEHLNRADAVAVGCGLDANDPAVEKLVREVVGNRTTPVIVDASALWFFNPPGENYPVGETSTPLLRKEGSLESPPLILTPHEGEFLRLLGTDNKDAINDRVAAIREFSQKHNVILVLKGERVLIGEPGGKVVVNPTGNSGLGKAGNGDTLAGIIAGFVSQAAAMDIDIFETVVAAVYIAGMAGDIAEKKFGKRVMTASDVRECLADAFAEFETETSGPAGS
ncbi:MAG TPA: NAD(P)H-hydrate dehydratase [Pyrinomonadaceae bacterium]|nr:NAD(P)H-hydrate dehydratase [Pyrinomonadaceae bacterium]HMP66455.1 NAD(P)H-hydrate dehydratase [Pyrinomonadaceae bacterium]